MQYAFNMSMIVCPAVHMVTRSLLRSSSTHEPSDPPFKVFDLFYFVYVQFCYNYTHTKVSWKISMHTQLSVCILATSQWVTSFTGPWANKSLKLFYKATQEIFTHIIWKAIFSYSQLLTTILRWRWLVLYLR